MATIDALKWQSLTAAVNEIKSPNQFLKRLLYGNHETKPTEDIEIGVLIGGRTIAPFTRKNSEAIMVGGLTEKYQTVSTPNIRIKRPFTPSELLFGRRPGTVIFSPSAGYQMSAINAHIARDMKFMADMITNAEEYLVAQSLQAAIAYSVTDQEVYTITYPRPGGCNITLSTFWNDATPANTRALTDIHSVKQVAADNDVPSPTDAICGSEAAAALLELVEVGAIKMLGTDGNNVNAGTMTFVSQFNDDGVIFLGSLGGVRFWEYRRTATLNGSSTDMIRAKYVEFVSTSPASDRVLYYGAIPDMKAFEGRNFQSERFSKSWEVEDPSSIQALTHSRPLPVPRRPAATISMKVVSG